MVELVPVDHDPFSEGVAPVKPAATALVPVDHDPFADDAPDAPAAPATNADFFTQLKEGTAGFGQGFYTTLGGLTAKAAEIIDPIVADAPPGSFGGVTPSESMRGMADAFGIAKEEAGYVPSFTPKNAMDALAHAPTLIKENIGRSLPYMGAALLGPLGMGATAAATTGNIAQERATNKGEAYPSPDTVTESLPAGVVSALLERLGARGIVKPGGATAIGNIARATAKEGGTELIQEGDVEPLGETLGTDKRLSLKEVSTRGVTGMIIGGGTGAGFRAPVEVGNKVIGIVAGRRGVDQGTVDPSTLTDEEVAAAISELDDVDLRTLAEANGIQDLQDPRLPVLQTKLEDRRMAEAQRAQVPFQGPEDPTRMPAKTQARQLDKEVGRLQDERAAIEAGEISPGAASAAGYQPARVPDVILQGQQRETPAGGVATIVPGQAIEPGTQAGFEANVQRPAPADIEEIRSQYGFVPESVEQQSAMLRVLRGQQQRQAENTATLRVENTGGTGPSNAAERTMQGSPVEKTEITDAQGRGTGQYQDTVKASGGSKRPFKADTSDNAELYENLSREKFEAERQKKWEEVEREWARRRAEQEQARARADSWQRRAEDKWQDKEGSFSNSPSEPSDDGYAVDDFGFVKSDRGGPVRFADQKQAAKWIVNVGHKRSKRQIFEIFNHPSGKGFTVRQRGLSGDENAGSDQGSQAGGQSGDGSGSGASGQSGPQLLLPGRAGPDGAARGEGDAGGPAGDGAGGRGVAEAAPESDAQGAADQDIEPVSLEEADDTGSTDVSDGYRPDTEPVLEEQGSDRVGRLQALADRAEAAGDKDQAIRLRNMAKMPKPSKYENLESLEGLVSAIERQTAGKAKKLGPVEPLQITDLKELLGDMTAQERNGVDAVPADVRKRMIDKINAALRELGKLGFSDHYQVNASNAPEMAQKYKSQIMSNLGAMVRYGRNVNYQNKGSKRANPDEVASSKEQVEKTMKNLPEEEDQKETTQPQQKEETMQPQEQEPDTPPGYFTPQDIDKATPSQVARGNGNVSAVLFSKTHISNGQWMIERRLAPDLEKELIKFGNKNKDIKKWDGDESEQAVKRLLDPELTSTKDAVEFMPEAAEDRSLLGPRDEKGQHNPYFEKSTQFVIGRFGDTDRRYMMFGPYYDYFVHQLGLELRGFDPDGTAFLYKDGKLVGFIMGVRMGRGQEEVAEKFGTTMTQEQARQHRSQRRSNQTSKIKDKPAEPGLSAHQRNAAQAAKDDVIGQLEGIRDSAAEQEKAGKETYEGQTEAILKRPSGGQTRYSVSEKGTVRISDERTGKDREIDYDTTSPARTKQAAEKTIEQLKGMPISRFYSNPWFDPKFYSWLLGPIVARNIAEGKRDLDQIGNIVDRIKRKSRSKKSVAQHLDDAASVGFDSNRAVGLKIAGRYRKEISEIETEIRKKGASSERTARLDKARAALAAVQGIVDMVATDPGSFREIPETIPLAMKRRQRAELVKLADILKKFGKDDMDSLADIMMGKKRANNSQAAADLRRFMDDFRVYMKSAGIEIGYHKNYFPISYDEEVIFANDGEFVKAAAKAYMATGLPRPAAEGAAQAWLKDILFGMGFWHGNVGNVGFSADKARIFTERARRHLDAFINKDTQAVLSEYIMRGVQKAEWSRRFGPSDEKLTDLVEKAGQAGVDPSDMSIIKNMVQSATGNIANTAPRVINTALGGIHLYGVIRTLPRAVLSMIHEPLVIGVQRKNPLAGLNAFAEVWTTAAQKIFHMPETMSQKESELFAKFIGVIGDSTTDMLVMNRYGDAPGSLIQAELMRKFFEWNLMAPANRIQRRVAARHGRIAIDELTDAYLNDPNRRVGATAALRDLGITQAQMQDFAKWLQDRGGELSYQDMVDIAASRNNMDKTMSDLYAATVARFADQSIQDPTAVDKPYLATFPITRMAFGLMSFLYTFQRNVTIKALKEMKTLAKGTDPVTGEKFSLQDRLMLGNLMASYVIYLTMAAAISELRERKLNPERHAERGLGEKIFLHLSRAATFGAADPVINSIVALKYERDLSSLMSGPYLGGILKSAEDMLKVFAKNSDTTSKTEQRALRALYEAVIVPPVVAFLSMIPGGREIKAASFVAGQKAAAPQTARDVGEMAGANDKKKSIYDSNKKSIYKKKKGDSIYD